VDSTGRLAQLAGIIAHEVRNPVAVIGNAIAGLKKASLSPADKETLLQILTEEATSLNHVVSTLLQYTRPLSFLPQEIELREFLQGRLGRHPTLTLSVLGDIATVWADPHLLGEALDGLLDNAQRAGSPGAPILVRAEAAPYRRRRGVALVVEDTGEGMPAHVLARAKEPFFTTRPRGMGLGLATVERIAKAHEGHLRLASEEGKGTQAWLWIPTLGGSSSTT
jgi:signal transduction histidine kinase